MSKKIIFGQTCMKFVTSNDVLWVEGGPLRKVELYNAYWQFAENENALKTKLNTFGKNVLMENRNLSKLKQSMASCESKLY